MPSLNTVGNLPNVDFFLNRYSSLESWRPDFAFLFASDLPRNQECLKIGHCSLLSHRKHLVVHF